MNVAISSSILDLFSPKFGLDGLGMPGEKIMLRVVVSSKDRASVVNLFGNYTIGGRHAQLATKEIERLGSAVDVVSVDRYTLKDFVEDVNKGLEKRQKSEELFRLVWENGRTFLKLDETLVPVTFRNMYTTAGKACGIFEYNGKSVKVVVGQDVEFLDPSRRKLSGFRLKGDKLILERAFQNPA